MLQTLHVKLFFFNSKTDYLPYYKNYEYIIDENKKIIDLLAMIQEDEVAYKYPKQKTLLQVNSILVDGRLEIKKLVEKFGNEICIENADTYLAEHDLLFRDDDFMQKYTLLAPYCDESDLKYYKTHYRTYYASEMLKYNREYQGDALFLLAYRLLENDSKYKEEILKVISDNENGIGLYEFENSTFPSIDISEKVQALKQMIEAEKVELPFKTTRNKIKMFFKNRETLDIQYTDIKEIELEGVSKQIHNKFKDFSIAYYHGTKAEKIEQEKSISLLKLVGAELVDFDLKEKACGLDIVKSAENVAYKKAGNILLDAFDNSADVFLVNTEEERKIFTSEKCSYAVGREIDLQIVTTSELLFKALAK